MLTNFLSRASLAIALAATVVAGVQSYRLQVERTAHEKTKTAHALQLAKQEADARKAVEDARTEEQRRTKAVQEIANDAESKLEVARADAGRARVAADGLRRQLAAFTAAHRGETRPGADIAGPGPAAGTAVDLLADLFSRADDAAEILAEALDRSREAGTACERIYDTVSKNGEAGWGSGIP